MAQPGSGEPSWANQLWPEDSDHTAPPPWLLGFALVVL